jgi:hypothetical protein
MTDTMTTRTPWRLWVVGVVSLLWNAFGCLDYTMTQLQGETWLRSMKMTDAQIAYFNAMPAWTHATWAIGVWGGLIGAILLLLRIRWALHAFVLSFAGFLGGLVYSYGLTDSAAVMGENSWIMQVVIGAGCVFFIWYAWTMGKRGVLR